MKVKRLKEKSQNSKTGNIHKKRYAEDIHQKNKWIAQKGSSPFVSLKQVITHTKGHYGWKNPNQFLKKE